MLFGLGASDTAETDSCPNWPDSTRWPATASATLPDLTTGQEQLSLFRTALPDDVLTSYLAEQIVARATPKRRAQPGRLRSLLAPMTTACPWATALPRPCRPPASFHPSSGTTHGRVTFDETAAEVAALQPDLSILVSYEEGPALLAALVAQACRRKRGSVSTVSSRQRLGTIAGGSNPASLDGFTVLGTNIGDSARVPAAPDRRRCQRPGGATPPRPTTAPSCWRWPAKRSSRRRRRRSPQQFRT